MGTARFFGSNTDVYCQQAIKLEKTWDSYKIKSDIHPNWGKTGLVGIVTSCKDTGSAKEESTKIAGHNLTIKLKKLSSKRSFFDFLWFLSSSEDDDAMGNSGNGKY